MTSGSEAADRPNVLFLAVDDMKDWVNCLGGYEGTVKTPNIDRLASQGTLFTNAHCASPKCAPSRAAIMTGLRPSTTGLYDNGHWWLPNHPEILTLPVYFKSIGYNVFGAGKIFHHTAGNNPPNQWDDFQRLLFRNDPWFRGSKKNYPWSRVEEFPLEFPFSKVSGLGHENDWGSLAIEAEQYDDALTAQYAVDFLEGRGFAGKTVGRPFFLACGIFRPHLPWYVPKEFFELYPIDEVALPQVLEGDLEDIPAAGKAFAKARQTDLESIRKAGRYRDAVQAYLASISYADYQVGRVLSALDFSHYANNTIVVLWSDHGWHLGEKGHWHKTTLWEEATRVPFIWRVPGFAPMQHDESVSILVIFPTLVDLCDDGAPDPGNFELLPLQKKQLGELDGESLIRLLRDANSIRETPAVIEFRRGNAAIRSQRYRYIRYADGSEELYDHKTDSYEWKNLASKPQLQTTKNKLAEWLPINWAPDAETKNAFEFDPELFRWKHKASGRTVDGNE
ncbi:MAG: sulfatase [Planctomycetota bacterium]|nr:sulfatase [Planctomycetota bacterium]